MKINLDALQAIDAIDTYGTFTEAAEKLHRVQSTLSYVVQKLESDLDIKVFDRVGNRVRLTSSGKVLLHEGRKILQATERLEHRIKKMAMGWEAEFRIVIDEMVPFSKLLPYISAFKNEHRSTVLTFSSEVSGGALDAVVNGRADMAIGVTEHGFQLHGISTAPLGQLALIFVTAPEHYLAGIQGSIEKSTLLQHCIVSLPDTSQKAPVFRDWLIESQDILYVPNLRTKLEALLTGLGGGFLPDYLARPYIESERLIEKHVANVVTHRQYSLIWRTDNHGEALKWWTGHIGRVDFFQNLSAGS